MRVEMHAYRSGLSLYSTRKEADACFSKWRDEGNMVPVITLDLQGFETNKNVLVLNPICAFLVFSCIPMDPNLEWCRLVGQICSVAFLVTVAIKKPPALGSTIRMIGTYVVQICACYCATLLLFVPWIVLKELLLRGLCFILPVVTLSTSALDSYRFLIPAIHIGVRLVIFLEMLINMEYYRNCYFKIRKVPLSIRRFLVDQVYALSYSLTIILTRFAVLLWAITWIDKLRPQELQNNVMVFFAYLLVEPYLVGSFITHAYQYAAHSLWHTRGLFYTIHADHHIADSQSALVGTENGYWESHFRYPVDVSCGDTNANYPCIVNLYLVGDACSQLVIILHHHYYDDCPTYRKFFGIAVFLGEKLSNIQWLTHNRMNVTGNGYYPKGVSVSKTKSIHGRHHWTTTKYTMSDGLIDVANEIIENSPQEQGPTIIAINKQSRLQ